MSYTGVLNYLLGAVDLNRGKRTLSGMQIMPYGAFPLLKYWKTVGFNMVIYLAALQTVPAELYEACTIDGGGARGASSVMSTLPMIAFPGHDHQCDDECN